MKWTVGYSRGNRRSINKRAFVDGVWVGFEIRPTFHIDGTEAWELKVDSNDIDGLVASGFNKDDLKKIVKSIEAGEIKLTTI